MKKIALLIVFVLLTSSSAAYSATFRAPVKRLTADDIFGFLVNIPYGHNITVMTKKYGNPMEKFDNNWAWEHKENGTMLRVYFSPAQIIIRAAIQEFSYSPQDSIARTEILAGQYERRFGPHSKDETNAENLRIRLWDIDNAVIFTILTQTNNVQVLYVMDPKCK